MVADSDSVRPAHSHDAEAPAPHRGLRCIEQGNMSLDGVHFALQMFPCAVVADPFFGKEPITFDTTLNFFRLTSALRGHIRRATSVASPREAGLQEGSRWLLRGRLRRSRRRRLLARLRSGPP